MRLECSKKILLASYVLAIVLTLVVTVGTFLGMDMGSVGQLAALSWGELAVSNGFYFWKSKNENRAKGVQNMIGTLAEKYGMEAVTAVAEVIFKD